MKKKNPAIAAVLNFFLPGWGFVYLGSPIMIVTGIALFICLLLNGIADLNATGGNEALAIVSGVGALLALAAISWAFRQRSSSFERSPRRRLEMSRNWIVGALLVVAIATGSSAQISVYIGTPPPVIVYEEPGPPPGVGFVWIEGYWTPAGHHYKWIRGHWERPPFEGAYWTHPHYDHYREGWEWHEGHWDHEDHDNGHWREHEHGRGHHDHDDHEHEHHD